MVIIALGEMLPLGEECSLEKIFMGVLDFWPFGLIIKEKCPSLTRMTSLISEVRGGMFLDMVNIITETWRFPSLMRIGRRDMVRLDGDKVVLVVILILHTQSDNVKVLKQMVFIPLEGHGTGSSLVFCPRRL
jgi:hypothetical protein